MTARILHTIEHALWTAAREQLPAGALTTKALSHAIRNRSELYTTNREELGDEPRGRLADDLAARALFFGVADAAKIHIPLAELRNRGVLPGHRPLRVADLGAGAGAMTLGMLGFFAGELGEIEVTAVDRDRAALELMRRAVAELPAQWRDGCSLETTCADVTTWRPAQPGFDLIIAGTLLNELEPELGHELAARWLPWLADDGALIILEPALRETTRELHELRDRLITERRGFVFAPCTRQQAPCPMLADERDWCHEDRPVDLPERTARLVRATGLRSFGLKFSYLVMRREPDRLVDDVGERRALRVVSRPRKLKGRLECFVCGDDVGRLSLRLLKRNRTDANRDLEAARRGDVVLAVPRNDVLADDELDVLAPSAPDPER